MFLNTPIPVCLWFLTNDKTLNGRDRRGETLFIDARQLGTMETTTLKVFTDEDIANIANTVESWKTGEEYEDVPGFCKSASLKEIEKNKFILTPGRFVGAYTEQEDLESYDQKIQRLLVELGELTESASIIDSDIRRSLNALGLR